MKRLCMISCLLWGALATPLQGQTENEVKIKLFKSQVILTDGSKVKGWFYDAAADSFVLYQREVKKEDLTDPPAEARIAIPAADISHIKIWKKEHLEKGIILGALGGGLLGYAVGYGMGSAGAGITNVVTYGALDIDVDQAGSEGGASGVLIGASFGAATGALIGTIPRKKYKIKGDSDLYSQARSKLNKRFSIKAQLLP